MSQIKLVLYDANDNKFSLTIGKFKWYTRSDAINSLGSPGIGTSSQNIAVSYSDGTWGANSNFTNDPKTSYASNNNIQSTWAAYVLPSYENVLTKVCSVKYAVQNFAAGSIKTLYSGLGGSGASFTFDNSTSGTYNITISQNGKTTFISQIDGSTRNGIEKWIVAFENHSNYRCPGAGVNIGFASALAGTFFDVTGYSIAAFTVGNSCLSGAYHEQTNPYEDGGYSGAGGGDPQKQNWSEDSDYVKEDAMPDETNYGAASTGLITIFTPTKAQLQKLSDVIWGRSFWQWVQSLIQNIDDLFISLGMVPFTITPGDTVEVTWLNYVVAGAVSFTDIYLNKCPSQFMEFDMGSISLNGSDDRIFANDSALDYSPYSKLGIYLPFIGYQELDIDECRGANLHLKYRIDVLSGTTVALLSLREQTDDPETSRTIYQFTGNCLTQLPITSADYQTMVTNAVNLGLSLTSAGATAAVASAGDFAALGFSGENMSAAQAALESTKRSASVANAGGGAISSTANAIMGMKPNFKKSGGIGASSSLLSVKQPYLFLTTPRQSMPEGYNKVCGFPCNIYGNLSTFSGFTVVEDIRLNGLVATSPEVEEIYYLLKSGVII